MNSVKNLTKWGSSMILIGSALLVGCGQQPSVGQQPTPIANPTPTSPVAQPEVFQVDAATHTYIDQNGKVNMVAVPYVNAEDSLSSQALLSECTVVSEDGHSSSGSLFYKRSTLPGDYQTNGVNIHRFELGGLKADILPQPYQAPIIDSQNPSQYLKDAKGAYLTEKAYPEMYLLGGIAGAGDQGRELYFGFRYVWNNSVNGLPGFEPYVQLSDPSTGRIVVANILPIIGGAGRKLQIKPNQLAGAEFEIVTSEDGVSRLFLSLPDPVTKTFIYTPVATSRGWSYERFSGDYPERILLWQGKIGDFRENPGTAENQLRKFELRMNYGPFISNGVLYKPGDREALANLISSRQDFISYQALPRFGELARGQLDEGGWVINKQPAAVGAFESLPDPKQICRTAKTQDKQAIVVGDSSKAETYQEPGYETPPLISAPLPRQRDVQLGKDMLSSESIKFDMLRFGGGYPRTRVSYPLSDKYELSLRFPNEFFGYGDSTGVAVDLVCKETGQYELPITIWDEGRPDDKKIANVTLDCKDNVTIKNNGQRAEPLDIQVKFPELLEVAGKVGQRSGIILPLIINSPSDFQFKVSTSHSDILAYPHSNLGILKGTSIFASLDCKTAGRFDRYITLDTPTSKINLPVKLNCSTIEQSPSPLIVTNTAANLVGSGTPVLTLSGAVGGAAKGEVKLDFQNLSNNESNSFALSGPGDLRLSAASGMGNQISLSGEFTCQSAGTFNKQAYIYTQFSRNQRIPLTVKVTCGNSTTQPPVPPVNGGVSITPIVMTGNRGTTLTGTSTISGVKSTINIQYDSTLPTTIKQGSNGTIILTSKFTCKTAGIFRPMLTARIDNASYTVPVTVTCK